MAREAKLSTGEAVWYVPIAFGNRKDPQPIRVLLAPLSAADYQRISSLAVRTVSRLPEAEQQSAMVGKAVTDEIVCKYVLAVENYSGRASDGRVVVAKDGETLLEVIYNAPSTELDLREEIVGALLSGAHLEDDTAKKSDTPSPSSAPTANQPATGRVLDAESGGQATLS